MDEENGSLLTQGMRKETQKPDWSRYGLSEEQQRATDAAREPPPEYEGGYQEDKENVNELFHDDKNLSHKPWWKSNFFIVEPILFGTWDGVFTSCMINIFGVVIFLRMGWMVGNAGIGLSVLIIFLTIVVALFAVLSAIGVCERCRVESGGVYFLLSHVLGARLGTTVGLLYCFGQSVACSLYVVGFGESISALLHQDNEWVSRGIAIGVLILLLGINVAGVKWVIRLQLILLMILFVAVLDFSVGSFVHTDSKHGVLGYSVDNFRNNTGTYYLPGESFFTVFGVFFPTATGVFAGINMSGDLESPGRNIPVGTLSAVGVSTFLYLCFALILGATCQRDILRADYMIAEKVSVVGFMFLAGLYISSISSCMGALYGAPRIIQSITQDNVIPPISFMGRGRGPNKVPVYALIAITLISVIFIFIGDVNTLGPIVTMPFMLTYGFVDYAYFSLAMSFDMQKSRDARYKALRTSSSHSSLGYESNGTVKSKGQYGAVTPKKDSNDLDKLFPERIPPNLKRTASMGSEKDIERSMSMDSKLDEGDTTNLLGKGYIDDIESSIKNDSSSKRINKEISQMTRSWYSWLCNRWLSLFGMICCFVAMFLIHWLYAILTFTVAIIIYAYIGQTNPGVFPGIAEFNLWDWIRNGFKRCCNRGKLPQEQIVVTPNTPAMNTMAAQLTEDNDDFADRGRYHQTTKVQGDNFDDYDE